MVVVLTTFSPPTEGIRHEQPSTKLIISDREIGCGTLYITESKLSWRNDASGEGLSLLYPHIAVHAVSRDVQRYGSECLMLMIDKCLVDVDNEGEEEGDSEEEEEEQMTEVRFVPDDKGQLDAMFQAMSHCQALHPDPSTSFSEDEEYVDADEEGDDTWAGGDAEYIYNENEPDGIVLNGLRIDQQGDGEMDTDGQFEDAEDD